MTMQHDEVPAPAPGQKAAVASILYVYDRPNLVSLRFADGGTGIAILAPGDGADDREDNRWMAVRVDETDLEAFLENRVSAREIFTDKRIGTCLTGRFQGDEGEELDLVPAESTDDSWLPDEGAFYTPE